MSEEPDNVPRGTSVTKQEESDASVNQPEGQGNGRDAKGRLIDGTVGKAYRWGPDNPPPRGGRPPDIWGRVRRKLLEADPDSKTKAARADTVADKIVAKLVEGENWQWIKETLDREHGKPKESVQVEGIVPRTLRISHTDVDELLEGVDDD